MTHETAEMLPTAIDQNRELFFAFEDGIEVLHNLVISPTENLKELFRILFKRDIGGAVEMGFRHGQGPQGHLGQLYIGDETGELRSEPQYRYGIGAAGFESYESTRKLKAEVFQIDFDLSTKFDFSASDSRIFQSVWKGQVQSLAVPGFVMQGKLTVNKQTHETIPITYSRNAGIDQQVRLLFGTSKGSKEFFKTEIFE